MTRQTKISLLLLFFLFSIAVFAPAIETMLSQDFQTQNLALRFAKPLSSEQLQNGTRITHWLGTDELGRDVLVRLIHGTRVSLGVAVIATIIAGLLGSIIGVISGYFGGWSDALLMRVTEALMAIPLIPVLIFAAAIDFKKIPLFSLVESPFLLAFTKTIVILCLFSWMSVSRLIRTTVLELKKHEYILASRVLGASHRQIIMQHILPQIAHPLMVSLSLGIGDAILFESALSFLGLGIQPPIPSWGGMLMNAQDIVYHSPLLAIAPGLLILITVLCFNSVAFGIKFSSATANPS